MSPKNSPFAANPLPEQPQRAFYCNPALLELGFWRASGTLLLAGDPLIDVDALSRWRLTPDQRRKILQTEVAEINVLRKKTHTDRPCGNEAFIERLDAITGRRLRPRKPGPRKKR